MRAFAVGLWKEWRDHRLVSIALLVALPVLVFAAAWAFGDLVPTNSFGEITLFTLNAAQALYVLAVASESFGGERRRGTLDFLRRLPRGLGRSFAAKIGAYVLGNVAALLWGATVAWAACRLFGPERAAGDFALLLLQSDSPVAVIAMGLFVLGLWTLFLSNVIPQGGAATVGAALLLGLLGLPAFLALKDHPWLVRMVHPETVQMGLAALAALGFVAVAYAFLRGNRLLASAWSPAWRGLAVIGVVTTAGYAWGAGALERALTIDPHQEDFRIADAYVGKGGRYLYATVYRGPDPYFEHYSGTSSGSPHQAWIVNLQDGSWRVAGDFFTGWWPLQWNNAHSPQPIMRLGASATTDVGWYDGETGTLRKTLPSDVRTPEIQVWQRSVMPALAWHKDGEGRALWLEGERVVHEGEAAPYERWFSGKTEMYHWVVPGGWYGTTYLWDKERRFQKSAWWLADAATGETRKVERVVGRIHNELVLSPKTVLRRSYASAPRGQKPSLEPWLLMNLEDGAVTPTANPPAAENLLRALPGERALLMAGDDNDRRILSTWNPRTGELKPVLDERGEPFVGDVASADERAPGGWSVVRIWKERESRLAADFALLDETTGRARRLPMHDLRCKVVCIESDGSVVALWHEREVVRFRLARAVDGREVFALEKLFPRAAAKE